MRVCCGCRKPLNQCECTSKMKENWIKGIEYHLNFEEERLTNLEQSISDAEEQRRQLLTELETLDYRNHCYEIEENLWKAVVILEQKGYHIQEKAWSNLQHHWYYDIFIKFQENYWFDFSNFLTKKGWAYDLKERSLQFLWSKVSAKYRKKIRMTKEQYLDWQREVLVQWSEQLPMAKLLSEGEEIGGVTKDGSLRQKK